MIIKQLRNYLMREVTKSPVIEKFKEGQLPYMKLMSYYKCAIMEVETKFKVLDEQFSLRYDANPIETIKTRLKSPESIMRKMKKKGLPFTTDAIEENITDIAGIRVICSFKKDIYKLAKCLLQQDDIILVEKKDYIENPKESGYRSLHLIVEVPIFLEDEKRPMKVEVQLRTIAMDFWASLEHKLRYKKDIAPELLEQLAIDLTECAEISASLDDKMENIKNRLEKR
ncbi:GTP pyrophosphokinase family protein [uncultured Eubacterium sp.]|uniref:GTP pyrophosphokinase n=1 Tax=uncultured Eubacterium sp. TaxID=165185 RepID=UPI002673BD3E|nr:GTP pyrophosphokinase family protein [uncultured Eubacterium sp.]